MVREGRGSQKGRVLREGESGWEVFKGRGKRYGDGEIRKALEN